MARTSRRQFLEQSMLAAAAVAAAGPAEWWEPEPSASRSTMDRLGVAVMGVRGRGNSHLRFFAGRRDTRVLYVCDCDRRIGWSRVAQIARRQGGKPPDFQEDIRRVLDDPRVDIVTIATPHHWHALAAIWAMQAGKDVYVEKPVSHNVQEGRRMVEAARRYQRICQAGLQARSDPGTRKAIAFVQSGAIGSVRLARGLSYRRRTPPDPAGPSNVPEHVDYSLWLGPAPAAPPMRPRFHHDWHWQWSYGNGDAGDQGVHQMDLCRWGLQCPTISHRVFSCGRSFSSLHAAETADTQLMIHQYPNATIVWESRGAPEPARRPVPSGVIFEGSEGYLVMTGYRGGAAFDRLGREIARFRGGGGPSHFSNFLQAVRRRRCQLLNADIEEGHLSGALCHTGNISYRLGRTVCQTEALGEFPDVEAVAPSDGVRERLEVHLRGDGSADDRALRRLGVVLACDPASETFPDHPAANSLLTRLYRRPFVVPAAGSV